MVVPEEEIATGQACVPLEDGVGVQTADNSRGRRVLSSLCRLPTNAKEVGDEVPINEVGGVCSKPSGFIGHVEACDTMG
jgi:hypothetical protein